MTRGERFKQAREAKGYSLREVSALSNIAKSTIVTLESEEYSDPKYYNVAKLADLYEIDLRWLMDGDDRRKGKWEWISVKDKMPKKDEEVLICYEWTGISGTVYREVDIASFKELEREPMFRPLYWMPLPNPPMDMRGET